MRSLLAVVVFGACAAKPPPVIANVGHVAVIDDVVIDPSSDAYQAKRSYWKKWGRAYMSQIPGPVSICERRPQVWIVDGVEQVTYLTQCSTYR